MQSSDQMEIDQEDTNGENCCKTTNFIIQNDYNNWSQVSLNDKDKFSSSLQFSKDYEDNNEQTNIVNNPFIRKTIAKLYKSQSKKFRKKQIMIVPNCQMVQEISQDYLITIFGCLEVETFYRDYQDPYDKNLILYVERKYNPVSVTKDFELNVVDIQLTPLSSYGITNFEFIIDRFIKMQNQDYLEVAKELNVYQHIVKNHIVPYMSKQKTRILKSIKKKEILATAEKEFIQYFKDYIRENHDSSTFYDYELYRSNFMTGEIELFQSGFSISLSSLLGVEQDQIENLIFRGQNYFNEQSGDFRLKFFLFTLKNMNEEIEKSEPFPFILRSYDGIVINCQAVIEHVKFPEDSKWIDKDDMFGILLKFDVSVSQIKAVLEIRSQQTNFDIEVNTPTIFDSVEYQMYQEIFLEKFYPNQFKQKENNKTEIINEENDIQNNNIQSDKNKKIIKKGVLII